MNDFKNRIAMVTGAANGIGKATAELLAQKGAFVYLIDKDSLNGKATQQKITDAGNRAAFYELDITDKKKIEICVENILNKEGALHIGVNNAGILGPMAPLHLIKSSDWEKTIAVNLTGQFFCMQSQIKAMLLYGTGSIVNVSSVAGLGGSSFGSSYSASKHGLIGLSKSAALEYAKSGLRINVVCPGYIETELMASIPPQLIENTVNERIPNKRRGKPSEVAKLISFLLSDEASYMNGGVHLVDGGMSA